jgi:predicted O-methyltransferase YrrM
MVLVQNWYLVNQEKSPKLQTLHLQEKKYGKLLSRIIAYYNPQTIVELGTSFGIGTLYLSAQMDSTARLFTIEGDKTVSEIANKYIGEITSKNISFINNRFEDSLPQLIVNEKVFDFVFFDGNHSEKATIEYFEQCMININEESVFVFDDIHWSKGMENAWNCIQKHPKTKVCLDLFQFGIVFFRKELAKQNYIIRF